MSYGLYCIVMVGKDRTMVADVVNLRPDQALQASNEQLQRLVIFIKLAVWSAYFPVEPTLV